MLPWWGWLLIILAIILLALLIWWWLRRRAQARAVCAKEAAVAPAPATAAPAPVQPDDLKLIEGIGPKIAGLLQTAGITTFAQLAATDVTRLRQILQDAGLAALADPSSWTEQAELAAAGKWDLLKELQSKLRGGRRVG